MRQSPLVSVRLLLGLGAVAFLVAVLSIVDMFLPRPFDGVQLDPDRAGDFRVLDVAQGSGAERAGIRPGDRIVGIANNIIRDREHAARLVAGLRVGSVVDYFVEGPGGLRKVRVVLGERQHGNTPYVYACLLGFLFFGVGTFALARQPRVPASQVFFILCSLFLLFLVCRLRPASYSQVDRLVLTTGTFALLLLPASFLHFFLIFPRPVPVVGRLEGSRAWARTLTALYLLPAAVMGVALVVSSVRGRSLALISGAPVASWWVLTVYVLLAFVALGVNARLLENPREQRGAAWVLVGSLFGLVPFLVLAVAFPSFLHTEKFLFYGVAPLVVLPVTFAYAIVRYRLLDIRFILRKGLLYTLTTAVVTVLYALGIGFFNTWFSGTALASSRSFPLVFALVIVLLFEPLRRRIQGPVDRFFFAQRARLQHALVEMGDALTAEGDLEAVVRGLVDRLPQLLELDFAALYLVRGEVLERVAGPRDLPPELPRSAALEAYLRAERPQLVRLERLLRFDALAEEPPELVEALEALAARGVEVLGDLASPRRPIGVVVLSARRDQIAPEPAEMELLQGLLSQAALALENRILIRERTRQAELERELAIASAIQNSLLPESVELGAGWQVAAVCRPARDVGGDFFAQLPGPRPGSTALVYGDVSGKSISGALMMMAVHEVLYTLAMTDPRPERLLELANRRLYGLGRRSFVALGYLGPSPDGGLHYALAGQPEPLKRAVSGVVTELIPPDHRLPLGAFARGEYRVLEAVVEPGELVVAYSDGVLETRSPDGEFFGFERLRATLEDCPPDPDVTLQLILDALDDFARGEEPYDDVTLLALARRSP